MPIEERAGVATNWRVIGDGPRPALAIHCMLGKGDMWEAALAPLGGQIAATVFDLPGHGKSADWAAGGEPGAFQTLATRVAASFIDRPVDLIGHSFGCSVALRIAVAAPEAVRSITLIEPVLFAAIAATPEGLGAHDRQTAFETLLAQGETERAARMFLGDWGGGEDWDALPDHRRARFVAQMPIAADVSASNFSDPGRVWRPDGIEAIDAPALIAHGDASPPAVAQISEAIAARFHDVGVAAIPGAGHMAPLTHAAQVSGLIGANLARS